LAAQRPVFEHPVEAELERLIQTAPPTPLSDLRPDLNPDFNAVVMKCLAKRPEDRWTAQELTAVLGTAGGADLQAANGCPACGQSRAGRFCPRCGRDGAADSAVVVRVENGPLAGAEFPLDGPTPVRLGRAELNPTDPAVSRRPHLMLERSGPATWRLRVTGLNHAWLENRPIREAELRDGDRFAVGATWLRVTRGAC
jgi:hypothetical protein